MDGKMNEIMDEWTNEQINDLNEWIYDTGSVLLHVGHRLWMNELMK